MKRVGARRATILRSLLGVIAAVGVMLVPTAAHATPSPSSVEKQITEQWNKLEPLIEQYNKVHNELIKNRAQLKVINKKLEPLELQVDLAMSQVGSMASDAYMRGSPGALQSMVVTGTPTGLTEKLTYLDQIARHQQEQVAGVAKLRDKYAKDKQDLATLTDAVAARDKDLATRKNQIQKKVDDLQKLRIQAYGASGADQGPLELGPCPQTFTQEPGNIAAQKACSLIGKPYIFGSAGPTGYDCSGLTQVAWRTVGVSLAHFTGDQVQSGRAISRSDLRIGDLIFYGSPVHHVAIYVGNGLIVHAPHTGDKVRMAKIDYPGTPSAYRRVG
ncbi:C40 family peptidase [Actinoplanes sp. N902-109]|uniref:C40 family peptidase n=1 Tax=Actinoplanes sp. (strain N902-109) TaxID=649831 RepID=UPI000329682A|nr:C40 family peptidase [Actinoplanes sp. N902-109]AGL18092.1 NLP/P60 protein [Actinoplanes sp. N902-109]